jgi:hypothetical protein
MIPFLSSRSKVPLPTHIDVAHGDNAFRVLLKRSSNARRYTLRASAAKHEITLTMPMRGSMAQASEFAHRHGGWIAERLKKFDTIIACKPGAIIPLDGIRSRTPLYQLSYTLLGGIIGLLKPLMPGMITDTRRFGATMLELIRTGYRTPIVTTRDINLIGKPLVG